MVLVGCTELSPTPGRRQVILFNDSGPTVTLAKNVDSFMLIIRAIPSPTDQHKALMSAAEVDGRLFKVANGTRAEVLKEVPISGWNGITILRIRLLNGPHITEEAICVSSVAQPAT
jgi:hypothetical protein